MWTNLLGEIGGIFFLWFPKNQLCNKISANEPWCSLRLSEQIYLVHCDWNMTFFVEVYCVKLGFYNLYLPCSCSSGWSHATGSDRETWWTGRVTKQVSCHKYNYIRVTRMKFTWFSLTRHHLHALFSWVHAKKFLFIIFCLAGFTGWQKAWILPLR